MHPNNKRRGYSEAERFQIRDPIKTQDSALPSHPLRISAGDKNTPFFKRLNEIIAEVYHLEEEVKCLRCRSVLVVSHKTIKQETRDKPVQNAYVTPGTINFSTVSVKEERDIETCTWTCCHCFHETSLSQEGPWRDQRPVRIYSSTTTGSDFIISGTGSSTGDFIYTGNDHPYWYMPNE